MGLLHYWTTYWFRSSPLMDLACCRIIIVGYQLYYLLKSDFLTLFSKLTTLPETLYDPLPILHLLIWPVGWRYFPSLEVLTAIHWTTVIAGFCAVVGFMTNGSLFLFAVGNVFMQAFIYSFGDFHHPEALMMIALSALALSPAGRVLSLDDIWSRLQFREKSKKFQASYILEEKSILARWPLLLVQWLFALIYLSAALSKLDKAGLDWMNGYTMQYYSFQDGLRWNIPLGIWLGQQHYIAWFLSWVAILFESTFFLVLLFP